MSGMERRQHVEELVVGVRRKQLEDSRGKSALAGTRFPQNPYHLARMYLEAGVM